MWDIALGVLILALASFALFRVSVAVGRRCPPMASNGLVSVLVALVILYAVLIHGRLSLARMLPFSNVIVVGNWMPLGAAMLAGIAGGRATIPLWRRVSLGLVLAGLASYTLIGDIGGATPGAEDPWFLKGFCMQTCPGSCSACSAAALLRHHGIPSSEREMIDLCLTRTGGTPPLGLYRGLKIKTRNTPWRVQVVRCRFEELIEAEPWPVLLLVSSDDPRIQDAANPLGLRFLRRADHTIVVFGLTDDGEAVIGDPAYGHERQTLDQLKACWCGEGLRLIRRKPSPDAEARLPQESLSKMIRRRPRRTGILPALSDQRPEACATGSPA